MNTNLPTSRRVNIRDLLKDPVKRKTLMVDCIIATQAREGVETTQGQAEAAYEKVQTEIRGLPAILPAVLKTFVTNGAGGYLVQIPSDNEHGFVLADDDQTWPGGLGCGWSEWTLVDRADVPPEVEERLGWLLDESTL